MNARHAEPTRDILIVVSPAGGIQPYFGGVKGQSYQSWKHFFACGIAAFADGDVLRIWAEIDESPAEMIARRERLYEQDDREINAREAEYVGTFGTEW